MKVGDVLEDFLRFGECFVDVVEVVEDDLPVAVEMVEGFVGMEDGSVAFVEVADELDGVGDDGAGVPAEEVGDGEADGAPQGGAAEMSEAVVHEKGGSLVREYQNSAGKVGSVLVEDVFCGILKEGVHLKEYVFRGNIVNL